MWYLYIWIYDGLTLKSPKRNHFCHLELREEYHILQYYYEAMLKCQMLIDFVLFFNFSEHFYFGKKRNEEKKIFLLYWFVMWYCLKILKYWITVSFIMLLVIGRKNTASVCTIHILKSDGLVLLVRQR